MTAGRQNSAAVACGGGQAPFSPRTAKKESVPEKASHRFVRRKLQNVPRKRHLFLSALRTCGVAPPGQRHKWPSSRAAKTRKSSEKTSVFRDSSHGNLCARFGTLRPRPHRFVPLIAERMRKSSGKTSLATKNGRRTCWIIAPTAQDRRESAAFLGENEPCPSRGRRTCAILASGSATSATTNQKPSGKTRLAASGRRRSCAIQHVVLTLRHSPPPK